jgi:hypothetical protein
MATTKIATLTNEIVDDFPAMERANSGNHGQRKTDVDVQLDEYVAAGANGVLKFLDFNVDAEGQPVDGDLARQRAQGRVAGIKARGYTEEAGWKIAARNGALYAKFYGPGNVPVKEKAVVGEDAVAESPVGERVPMPV